MPKHYRHLSADERDHLAVLRSEGVPLRAIARVLGRDPATISRELTRNVPPLHTGYYLPHKAQARAEARWRAAVRRRRLRDPWVRGYVTRQLQRGWSPELIAGRLTRLLRLAAEQALPPGDVVVAILTGHGLKDVETALGRLRMPDPVPATFEAIAAVVSSVDAG